MFSRLFLFVLLTTTLTFSQTTFFIKYKDNVDKAEIENKISTQQFLPSNASFRLATTEYNVIHLAKGLAKQDEVIGRIIKITFESDFDEATFLSFQNDDHDIEYIQKSTTYKLNYIPNDSLVSQQWALEKINAFDVWDITQGRDTILVSVIDTGIDYLHPDLQNKIYFNPGEIPDNNIDDDQNGFIDDYMGWDFVDRVGFPLDTTAGDYHDWDNNPMDEHSGSHGTAVSGIIGAEINNGIGIAGVAPGIKILNVRSFDPGGFGEEDDAAAAILYSVLMGAKVINMSWGDYSFSYVLRDVIRYAYSQNVVLIGSSGNSLSPSNLTLPHYPSGYPEVISVGNSTINDTRALSSVYGSTLDLVAPGTQILTTARNNDYTTGEFGFSGTSAAAPHVSGAAALILSLGNFSNEEVKQIIKSTCDDIHQPGWDLQTGAGRLNLFKALSVLAPAAVKFNFPAMDYGTNGNSIDINATILSPYFVSFSLMFGRGYNPEQWASLIQNGQNQFSNEIIYNLDISSLNDDVYTLRLLVNQNNGGTLEERIHFHIMRTAPKVTEVGLGALYYGDKSTIAGEFLTNQPSVMRLYYRKYGESNFNYISLDGFNTNNQFVKTLHYGFIPKDLIQSNTLYEIYFEAENLAGLKTVVVDSANSNNYFLLHIEKLPESENHKVMNFSLQDGNLYHEPMSFFSDNYDEVFCQLIYTSQVSYWGLYKYNAEYDSLIKMDSLTGKFPRAFGDFNNDRKKNFISFKTPDIIIDEVIPADTFNFIEKYNSPDLFNVAAVEDLNGDGNYEIIQQKDQTSYRVWKIKSDFTLEPGVTFYKTYIDADSSYSFNNYIYDNILVTDSDNDGKKEIWFVDADGDLIQYVVNDLNNIVKGNDSLKISGLTTLKNYIFSAGDYDGDGKKDFAILYNTHSIAPSFLLLIVSFENNQPRIITQKVFLDQSAEYSGGLSFNDLYQSLRFVDVDNDNKDELVLCIFPYIYLFKYSEGIDKIIFFDEGVNNFRIFAGDLNQNGVKEIGLRYKNKIEFIELGVSKKALIPSNFAGYSISSNTVKLSWNSSAQKYYIYKGTDRNNITLIDSVFQQEYSDINAADNTFYYYAVQAYDASKPEPLSALSKTIEVYSHTPAKPMNAVSNSNSSVIVTFSEKMKNVIENLQSFIIPGIADSIPNSISPNNQYSYLLSFRNNLPAGEQLLIVKDIKDLYGSPIAADTLNFNVITIPEVETFYISSFEIINPYRVKLTFNFQVDEAAALIKENYSFQPQNFVSSIELDNSDKKIIYLNLDGTRPIGSIGKEYRLHIVNLKSSLETGSLTINSGAGSYVVLTAFASDLSDVYVYPNPSNSQSEKITFANLPKRAKIVVFNLSGKKINEIEETDGNGGVDFNLTLHTGEKLGSGIYIYRIVMLDDSNNEVEEKIGKFAILR